MNLVGFLLQMFVVSRVFKYLGVGKALFIHPLVALTGYGLILTAPVAVADDLVKVADNSLDYSLGNTTKQALWLPTSREAKYKAKQAVDSFFVRAGDVCRPASYLPGSASPSPCRCLPPSRWGWPAPGSGRWRCSTSPCGARPRNSRNRASGAHNSRQDIYRKEDRNMMLTARFVPTLVGAAVLGALAWAPLTAQQERQMPASPPQAGTVITKKDPLRFTAFGVNMQRGFSGTIDIGIERWTTDAERASLLDVVAGTKEARSSQDKLVSVLQDVKPRAGYIRSARSVGWDIMYARENMLPDGTRQIVIVTDKPVTFWAASNSSRTMDYPFTMVEMRFPRGATRAKASC